MHFQWFGEAKTTRESRAGRTSRGRRRLITVPSGRGHCFGGDRFGTDDADLLLPHSRTAHCAALSPISWALPGRHHWPVSLRCWSRSAPSLLTTRRLLAGIKVLALDALRRGTTQSCPHASRSCRHAPSGAAFHLDPVHLQPNLMPPAIRLPAT
ncbi:hypothetical protein SMALB_3497 [Streptomyces malaysiensis]|uniref:Uncharacterized protein n=1 Tax=Streptomyces malaysiensis TaxID=92644 RepID=A0A7X5X4V3_STRMQ|nr:hypothetical protein [Streptomyces malaysiensis]